MYILIINLVLISLFLYSIIKNGSIIEGLQGCSRSKSGIVSKNNYKAHKAEERQSQMLGKIMILEMKANISEIQLKENSIKLKQAIKDLTSEYNKQEVELDKAMKQ